MLSKQNVIAVAVLVLSASPAWADIFKCVDEAGHVTYTNQRSSAKGCALLSKDQAVSTVSGPRSSARQPTPSSFPRVDSDVQKQRDNDRRKILEQELATEQTNLEQAKKELADQEAVRSGNEKNYQRVLDRLQPYKDKVALHERNIDALKKEIANLK